ncbi:hypothetical protein JOF41_001038 [Saccharothrix coeruleofusca]|uniref:NB-ARC domain-containing protein n=1 Tax=Saccharothrix coeruleofusca TaxID=33919 RepID=UPI001AE51B52|nr:NB-ARC domain-containing protein [Saccharothrix coeruleofusca]MBP2334860.1 hypothetical protein [Saccharothrix coeruleofusca]
MWNSLRRWAARRSAPHEHTTGNNVVDNIGGSVQAGHIEQVHLHTPAPPRARPPAESSPGDPHRSLSTWQSHALVEPQELVHVQEVVAELARAIANPTSTAAISVSGAGGLGKTAITHAAVQQVATSEHFTHVVWASAKNTRFSNAGQGDASVDSIYWHDVLRMIAAQLNCPLSPNQALWEQELTDYLAGAPADTRALVVVDNLEVVHAADRVFERLGALGLRHPHVVVVTSRWAVVDEGTDVRDFRIVPLTPAQTYDLVRLLAADTGSDLGTAQDEDLAPVFGITEGNPFLIKLITRRFIVTGRSLERVISELRSVADGKLGGRVRTWLFDRSLDELSARFSQEDAVGLLFSFCASGRGDSLTYHELRAESGVASDDRFESLLETACRLSLVRPSDRNRRYSVHSLLYEYTCPLAWQRQGA